MGGRRLINNELLHGPRGSIELTCFLLFNVAMRDMGLPATMSYKQQAPG
jgi:hypothetical protein